MNNANFPDSSGSNAPQDNTLTPVPDTSNHAANATLSWQTIAPTDESAGNTSLPTTFNDSPVSAGVPVVSAQAVDEQKTRDEMARPIEASRPQALQPVTAMLLGGALSCLLVGMGFVMGARRGVSTGAPDPVQQIGGISGAGALSGVTQSSGNAIVDAVKRVGPAVMNVDSKFGKGGTMEFLPSPGQGDGPREGKGTGVVIDSKRGLMLTNAHVVYGATAIEVTTPDNQKFSGRLVGSDRLSDIALVELANKNLPQAKLATLKNARDLQIGEWAIAIGNPFAQENTVTVGVISAVGRTVGPAPVPGGKSGQTMSLTDMVQTDAAINPGNSGGPLCNINGEVIGINTAIIPFGTGLGFTIPINKAKAVADMLLRNGGKVPFIGVEMLPVTKAIQKDLGLKEANGVLIKRVVPNSPAAQAGIQTGDVIRRIDDKPIKDSETIQDLVRLKNIGETANIEILRNGNTKKTLKMKIAARPNIN